jgi:hypothetical protein
MYLRTEDRNRNRKKYNHRNCEVCQAARWRDVQKMRMSSASSRIGQWNNWRTPQFIRTMASKRLSRRMEKMGYLEGTTCSWMEVPDIMIGWKEFATGGSSCLGLAASRCRGPITANMSFLFHWQASDIADVCLSVSYSNASSKTDIISPAEQPTDWYASLRK